MIHSLVLHYLTLWRPLGYSLVFLGMVLEGEVILFIAAFLTQQGFFDVGDMVLVIAGGVLLGDLLWYRLGFWLEKRSPSLFSNWARRIAEPFDVHLRERPFKTIFISKFTYGLHHAILMRAGALGIALPEFIRDNFIASASWIAIIGALGYFFSVSFLLIRRYLRFAEVALGFALLFFLLLWRPISESLTKKL